LRPSQSGDDPDEDLAKFNYKPNMKIIFKNLLSIWLCTRENHANVFWGDFP
jgi:hypothetical protein